MENNMNITFITGHLCKERHALLNELALDLGKYGAKVTVLTGFPSRRISDEVRKYYLNHEIEQISDNVIVKRIGSKSGEGDGLFVRMIKYLVLTWNIYEEAKKTPTDVYYIYSSPPFLGYIGVLLSRIAPTVYNAQDLFPDTLIKIKKYSIHNPLIIILRYLEKMVYKYNSRIITISNEMKNTILEHSGLNKQIDVIYNWADVVNIKNNNKLMDELGIDKDKFIVSYAGDIGLFQGWPIILQAIKIIQEQNKNIHFVIIGNGSYKQELESNIKKLRLFNVSVFPLQPASRLSEIYSVGDLELVSIESGLSKMALPSKTFVIMAAGSPLLSIVDQDSEIAQLIKEKKMGYTVAHGNADILADVILNAYEKKVLLKELGNNARVFCEKEASRKIQTKKYYDVLFEVAKGIL